MARDRKRTDERDAERAMLPVLAAARQRQQEAEDDAILRQAERDAFPERQNMLPLLLDGVPGVTIVLLGRDSLDIRPDDEQET